MHVGMLRRVDLQCRLGDPEQQKQPKDGRALPRRIGPMQRARRPCVGREFLAHELLLPSDDAPLTERAAALGQWCQGFLAGFGLNSRDSSALSVEATEVLQDLAAIAQVQDALEESDDGESDYMEVMEYLRVAPLLLFTETNKTVAPAAKPSLH